MQASKELCRPVKSSGAHAGQSASHRPARRSPPFPSRLSPHSPPRPSGSAARLSARPRRWSGGACLGATLLHYTVITMVHTVWEAGALACQPLAVACLGRLDVLHTPVQGPTPRNTYCSFRRRHMGACTPYKRQLQAGAWRTLETKAEYQMPLSGHKMCTCAAHYSERHFSSQHASLVRKHTEWQPSRARRASLFFRSAVTSERLSSRNTHCTCRSALRASGGSDASWLLLRRRCCASAVSSAYAQHWHYKGWRQWIPLPAYCSAVAHGKSKESPQQTTCFAKNWCEQSWVT